MQIKACVNQEGLYLKKYDMATDVMKQIKHEKKTTKELNEYLLRVRNELDLLQKKTELKGK